MIDLRQVLFPGLENLDATNLTKISLTRDSSGWNNAAKESSLCSCNGSCINNRCKCTKAGLTCSAKCHPTSTCCQNRFYSVFLE